MYASRVLFRFVRPGYVACVLNVLGLQRILFIISDDLNQSLNLFLVMAPSAYVNW
jgi:hypothetical protein